MGAATEGHSHLSRIDTLWSVVRRAHQSEVTAASAAQQQLLELYGGAIRRYLIASLRDQDLADELFQEFALKFVNGSFRHADPDKGRFRAFVKTVLYRMIADHFRKKASRKEQSLPEELSGATDPGGTVPGEDERFLVSWREQILDRTWQALADHESRTGVPYHRVLRLRVSEPGISSERLAGRIAEMLGKTTSSGSARVLVHRAREKFANLLVGVVADSLSDGSDEAVEAELIELRLMVYCRDVLKARKSAKE